MRVLIWNSDKADGAETWLDLKICEMYNGNISSTLTVTDDTHLHQTLAAIYNETSVDLCFHIIDRG